MPPLIAVTGRHLERGRVSDWDVEAIAVKAGYTQAIARAGGRAAVLPPTEAFDILDGFDGLVITGGVDIDAARYGAAAHPENYGVDPALDAFEVKLVEAALFEEIPILAICRGHQVLNVALGGTLDQHLPDHASAIEHGGSDHEVRVTPGSLIAEAIQAERASVRSHHHQAVATLGKGLVATAWSDDGVIEGMELPGDAWVVAVQWHPEMTAAADPVQQRLFDTLVDEAS